MVQVAHERIEAAGLGDRLRAVQADLTTDRLDGTYDVVWSSMALHHVPDLGGLLRSVAGLLTDGGRLAVADPEEDPDGAFQPARPTSTGAPRIRPGASRRADVPSRVHRRRLH